jgi:hypothetical protein
LRGFAERRKKETGTKDVRGETCATFGLFYNRKIE